MEQCKIKIECYLTKEKQFRDAIVNVAETDIDWIKLNQDCLIPKSMYTELLSKGLLKIGHIRNPTTQQLLDHLTIENVHTLENHIVNAENVLADKKLCEIIGHNKQLALGLSNITLDMLVQLKDMNLIKDGNYVYKLLYNFDMEATETHWNKANDPITMLNDWDTGTVLKSKSIPKSIKQQTKKYKYEIECLPIPYYGENHLYLEDVEKAHTQAKHTISYWLSKTERENWKQVLSQAIH